jgi:septin family protein
VILDYQDFTRLIERFATELPEILASHHKTADLAPDMRRLLQVAETPFTLAVVGQMRAGKSSLLNALIGTDLAVVGVNETTATINWFKYGHGNKAQRFCVNWKDRPAEEFELTEIRRWVGDSADAAATNCLEFFADTSFLRIANIVDTPGTRSAIQNHTDAVNEFLAAKRDGETRRLGGEADAILYVVPPVARESDEDILKDFENTTRLPGSSPYNSMAAVHKWETLDADEPHAEALQKAARIFKAMRGLVSVVIPVSAPLGKAAEKFADRFWQDVLNLTANTPAQVLDDMLLGEEDFRDEVPRCSVPVKERHEFQSKFPMPWPCLKFIIQTARKKSPANHTDLRRTILETSGMERLRQELQTRFFAKSKVIKTFSVLSKARESGRIADVRLRNHKNNLTRILQTAATSQSALAERIQRGDSELRPAQEYIQTTLQTIERDLDSASETLRLLGKAVLMVEDAHQEMDADLKYLEKLQHNGGGLTPESVNLLTTLFGGYGATLPDRLSFFHRNGKDTVCLADLDAAIENLKCVQVRGKRELSEIAAHGVNRLETIANWMEEQNLAEIQLNKAH